MKKLVNHPDHVARETIEGLTLAYPQLLRAIEGATAVLRRDAPVEERSPYYGRGQRSRADVRRLRGPRHG